MEMLKENMKYQTYLTKDSFKIYNRFELELDHLIQLESQQRNAGKKYIDKLRYAKIHRQEITSNKEENAYN